jgi:hypothetical protein
MRITNICVKDRLEGEIFTCLSLKIIVASFHGKVKKVSDYKTRTQLYFKNKSDNYILSAARTTAPRTAYSIRFRVGEILSFVKRPCANDEKVMNTRK